MAEKEKAFYVSGVSKDEYAKGRVGYRLSLIEMGLEDAQSILSHRADITALEEIEAKHLKAIQEGLGTFSSVTELEEKTQKSLGVIAAVPKRLSQARERINATLKKYSSMPTHEAYSKAEVKEGSIVTKAKDGLLGLTALEKAPAPKIETAPSAAASGHKVAMR